MHLRVALCLVSTIMVIAKAIPQDVFPVPSDYPGVKASLDFLARLYGQQSYKRNLQTSLVQALAQVVDDGRVFFIHNYFIENGAYGRGNIIDECRSAVHFGFDTTIRLVDDKPPVCRRQVFLLPYPTVNPPFYPPYPTANPPIYPPYPTANPPIYPPYPTAYPPIYPPYPTAYPPIYPPYPTANPPIYPPYPTSYPPFYPRYPTAYPQYYPPLGSQQKPKGK